MQERLTTLLVKELQKPVSLALGLAVASAGVLVVVHGLENFAGLHPCELCLGQREPFWWAIPIALGYAGLIRWAAPTIKRLASAATFVALAVVFAVSTGLAIQHVGVEEGWWTAGCTQKAGASIDDLLNSVGQTPLVRCDEKAPFLFGLTLAAYNILLSLGLMALALWGGVRVWRLPPLDAKVPLDEHAIKAPGTQPQHEGREAGRANQAQPD